MYLSPTSLTGVGMEGTEAESNVLKAGTIVEIPAGSAARVTGYLNVQTVQAANYTLLEQVKVEGASDLVTATQDAKVVVNGTVQLNSAGEGALLVDWANAPMSFEIGTLMKVISSTAGSTVQPAASTTPVTGEELVVAQTPLAAAGGGSSWWKYLLAGAVVVGGIWWWKRRR